MAAALPSVRGCPCTNPDDQQFSALFYSALRVLKTLHAVKHILNEEECRSVGKAGDWWEEELPVVIVVKGAVHETLGVLEEYKGDYWYDEAAKGIKMLSELYQEKLVTEDEVKKMKGEGESLSVRVVLIQFTKPPEVVARTVNMLDKYGHNEEANQLRVLNELFTRHLLTAEECSKVARKRWWEDRLNLVLLTKPAEVVQEACQVMEKHGCPVDKDLKILNELFTRHLLTAEECSEVAWRRSWEWDHHLTQVLSTKPAEVVQEAHQVLEKHGYPVEKLKMMSSVTGSFQPPPPILARIDIYDTRPGYSTNSGYGGSSRAAATSTYSNSHLVEYQKVAKEPHTEEHSLSSSLNSVEDEDDATSQWSKVPSEPAGGESDPHEEPEPATVKERQRSAPTMRRRSVPRIVLIRRSASDPSLLPETVLYRKYHEDPTSVTMKELTKQTHKPPWDKQEYVDTVSPEINAVEASLERLCYMATSIKQLRVFPSGGTFKLGSGDASLEVPQGAVDKETTVRYAIILHGPFVFLAGHKLVSVVVYLNMDGAILLKPVLLHLSHWCIKEEGEDQDTLKFATAPHILPSGQQYYDFEEQEEASFTTHTNVGILKISEPQCLHCVEAGGQNSALYRALTFAQRPSEGMLFFRIQLMCNSLDWIESLTTALQRTGWKTTSCDDIVSGSLFEYSGKVPIEASLVEPEGYNWTATIEGNSKVEFKDFFLPKCKCTSEIEEAIQSGRSPPSIVYKIVYTIPQKQQVKPAVLKVALRGKDLELLFSCPIMQCSQTTAFTDDVERGTDSAQNTAPAVNGGKHTAIVSQTVSDRPDHLMLFRTFVSRNAATKGRAVLEGVWLDSSAIEACFNNADSEEAAVQAGLVKWKDGHSRRPPTWEVLLTAMDYAKIAQQHIRNLRKELALDWES